MDFYDMRAHCYLARWAPETRLLLHASRVPTAKNRHYDLTGRGGRLQLFLGGRVG